MELFEKVQVLKKKADISYEEARNVLEEAGGDLLEAMILLERRGRIDRNERRAEEAGSRAGKDGREKPARNFGRSFGRMISALFRFIKRTSFSVTRGEKVIFTMPTFVFALLLFFVWEPVALAMIIALFFGVRYSFSGAEAADKANMVLQKAGDFAQDVKSEFTDPVEESAGEEPEEKVEEKAEETAEEMHLEF